MKRRLRVLCACAAGIAGASLTANSQGNPASLAGAYVSQVPGGMYYAGQHDGEDAHGVIKELSPGNYLVSLEVVSSRGGGAVTAYATGA